jgi:hypothetical protein
LEPVPFVGMPHSRRKKSAHSGTQAYSGSLGNAMQNPPAYDGWEIEEQLRYAFRVLGGSSRSTAKKRRSSAGASSPGARTFRVDAGHGVPSPISRKVRRPSRRIDRAAAVEEPQRSTSFGDRFVGFIVWTALTFGTMAVVCGLALLGWSAQTGQPELWKIGAPIILGAQVALVLGLVLQLDRIWRDSRRSAARLRTVDQQLDDLKTTTSLLGTTHAPSTAFYAHWAGGAGPDVLLTDLKSQLDLLAIKLARE